MGDEATTHSEYKKQPKTTASLKPSDSKKHELAFKKAHNQKNNLSKFQTMKKLNFNEVKAKELLDIKSMRNVRGGGDSGTCGVKFIYPIEFKEVIGYKEIIYKYDRACGMSYATMTEAMSYGNISRWCCDSCPQTEYCG